MREAGFEACHLRLLIHLPVVGGVMGGPTAPVVAHKAPVLRWDWLGFSEFQKKKKHKNCFANLN